MTSRLDSRFLLLTLVVAPALVGCSMFQEQLAPVLEAKVVPSDGLSPTTTEEKFVVEIHPEEGKPKVIEKAMSEPLHVQEALEQTGAHKKYRRFYLELMRPMPSGGWHEMTLAYDQGSDRVAPEFDYAILPGDRIVVTEDPSSFIDDLMQPVLRPLGMANRNDRKAQVAAKYNVRD
jgi:hypothetical protein